MPCTGRRYRAACDGHVIQNREHGHWPRTELHFGILLPPSVAT